MSKRLTTKQFIKRAIAVHGNKYDYSLVEYVNAHTKVKIICEIHGVFEQNKIRDSIKTKYCLDNGINLIRIPYTEFNNIENILKKGFK